MKASNVIWKTDFGAWVHMSSHDQYGSIMGPMKTPGGSPMAGARAWWTGRQAGGRVGWSGRPGRRASGKGGQEGHVGRAGCTDGANVFLFNGNALVFAWQENHSSCLAGKQLLSCSQNIFLFLSMTTFFPFSMVSFFKGNHVPGICGHAFCQFRCLLASF